MMDNLVTRLKEENELLQEQVRQLRSILVDEATVVPLEYKLTRAEVMLYRHLSSRRLATYDSIAAVLYGTDDDVASSNTVSVFIHKIRKKLRPHGIEIINHWGRGYSIKGRYTENNDGVVA